MAKKFIIKDDDGQEFEVTEQSDEELSKVHDDELLTADEIAALKELAKHSTELLEVLEANKEQTNADESKDSCDNLDFNDEDEEKKEEVIETKTRDSRMSVGSIERYKAKDSVSNFDKEIEISNAWSNRFNKELFKKSSF